MKRDWPKCECGVNVSLHYSERLGRYVCPTCLEAELVAMQAVKAKPWEVTYNVWKGLGGFHWQLSGRNHRGVRVSAWNERDALVATRRGAKVAVHHAMKRLGLVERKAKAGKVTK